MGITPTYQFPYPELTDPPDGPAQIKALALALEAKMVNVDDMPVLRAQRNTAFSVPSASSPISLPFSVLYEDPTGMGNANKDQFTIKKAGIWLIAAAVAYDFNATGPRYLSITGGGVTLATQSVPAITQSGWATGLSATAITRLVVGQIVTMQVGQLAGVALNTSVTYPPVLCMTWMKP